MRREYQSNKRSGLGCELGLGVGLRENQGDIDIVRERNIEET